MLPPLFLLVLLAVSPVFADDGGWLESGGTLSGWIGSPGAGRAVAMGILPAAGSGLGVLFGTALGSMVSIIGAAGIPPIRTHIPSPKGSSMPAPKSADHLGQQETDFGYVKGPEAQTGSRTADYQTEQLEYQESPDPGQISSRHRPGEMADAGSGSPRSERAGFDGLSERSGPADVAKGPEAKSAGVDSIRSGEGMSGPGTGQRDVRGVEPTTSSGSGSGSGAADSAGRAAGFDQEQPTGQLSTSQNRPGTGEGGSPLAGRHQPGGLAEASDSPANIEQPGLRSERHTPDTAGSGPTASRHEPGGLADGGESPTGLEQPGTRAERHTPSDVGSPTASRYEPGGLGEQAESPAALEQPGLRAERHTPDEAGSPLAERHDPTVEGGGEMRARRAPDDEASLRAERFSGDDSVEAQAGPRASRHSASETPGTPIPPAPVPGYVLDWELVVVRTPPGSGLEVQQHFELEGQTKIGRHGKIDIKILDPKVSRQHADIVVEGSACRIVDLDSSNGTFVNGRRISEPVDLQHGDAVKIGDSYFVVQQRTA
jgi:hypothetical protein